MILQQVILKFLILILNKVMAKSSNKSSSSSQSSSTRTSSRPKPMIPKAGYTKSGRRSYGNGGKV